MAHPDDHPPCWSTHRAFVVPCAADTAVENGYLAGRVGHVVSRQAPDVPSLEALLASIAQALHHTRLCVPDGARLLLVDFWTDPTHTHPLLAALMAGEFIIHSGGDVYTETEARGWLTASGWRTIERTPLAGPVSLLVAETAA